MIERDTSPDLTPWEPVPTDLPTEWMLLVDELSREARGTPRPPQAYALKVRYDARRVGDLLRSWQLPWQVVMAGYLREYDEERLRAFDLPDRTRILAHIKESLLYARYIEEEQWLPLLTLPYRDLGALLIATAVYYQALIVIQERYPSRIHQQRERLHIESVRRTLLHIAKRLNMWNFKRSVEDLTEQLCYPLNFAEDQQEYSRILTQDAQKLEDIRQLFITYYRETTGLPMVVDNTACGVAGLKRRIQDSHTTATTQKTELTGFDLITFNITVPTIEECYKAFGVLSQLGYIQDRVTDQIANPKPNGYSHLAFGLVLDHQVPCLQALSWLQESSYACSLQIATSPLQAIMKYGCLYPFCYQLYIDPPPPLEELQSPTGPSFWHSREGKAYYAIQEAIARQIASPPGEDERNHGPVIVYDKNRNPIAVPKRATALDLAYKLGDEIGARTAEVFINNRKAPLSRELDTGDVVEIRTSPETQIQDYWLDEKYATTIKARNHIQAQLRQRLLEQKGYYQISEVLERYSYSLTLEQLEEELRFLVAQKKLGTLQFYLEQLQREKEPPWTAEWAAQQILLRRAENDTPSAPGETQWIPVPVTADSQTFRPYHFCGICQPAYPHTITIVGLVRPKKREMIVHAINCPRLTASTVAHPFGHTLIPMEWQCPPSFRVAFLITGRDRRGLVNDITGQLRQHQCIIRSIHAEALTKFNNAEIRLVIETHEDREVVSIYKKLARVESVSNVKIDPIATLSHIYERLQKLLQPEDSLETDNDAHLRWNEYVYTLKQRMAVLKNPYDISRPATSGMFFGRTEEMKRLHRELCDTDNGKSMVLYGPRRSGKSSICKNFLERYIVPPYWHTFYSLQGCTQQGEETVLRQIAEEIGRRFSEQLHRPAPSWSDFSASDLHLHFKRFVQYCLAQVPGSRLILALDEFGGALTSYQKNILEPRFFTYWRELTGEIPQLSLLIALPTSSHTVFTLHAFPNAFSFAETLPVVFLDKESAERLLVEPLREQQVAIHPHTVIHAIHLTGGNPYYLTLIGQQLVFLLNLEPRKQSLTDKDLTLAVERIIEQGSDHNFIFYRDELQSELEARILEAIVELTERNNTTTVSLKKIAGCLNLPEKEIRPALERLRNGLILNEHRREHTLLNPHYSFKIELVRHWLSRNHWFFTHNSSVS
jgi:(p)ppGpp synthase/HD superfamily hydrolase